MVIVVAVYRGLALALRSIGDINCPCALENMPCGRCAAWAQLTHLYGQELAKWHKIEPLAGLPVGEIA
jgi:hypothetical protein